MIKNKKAISEVITTVLMIALVLAAIAVVWGVVMNLVQKNVDDTTACFGNFDKVTFNDAYTCYDSKTKEMQISISVDNLDSLDSLLVSISGSGQTKSYKLENGITNNQIKPFSGNYGETVSIPSSNEGKTYVFNISASEINSKPDEIRIAPVISKKQCEVSDKTTQIDFCSALS